MPRRSHFSLRLSEEQRRALDRKASDLDISVGELVRRALAQVVEAPAQTPPMRSRSCGPAGPIRREDEASWLEANLPRLVREIPGHWLILDGPRLVAHGASYEAAFEQARRQGVEVPFAHRVPESPAADTAWIPML
ncbi:MAG: ribbon-helix-helix protein, CopG family [Armatimonadetes bacterium]|nr:ribbon-helix-helix protein, CopG family [Armatimonadota bacterium]